MKMLWLKTVELLRRYPVLWLPVMWAGLLSYGWTQLRHIVTRDLVGLMLRDHSATGRLCSMLAGVALTALAALNLLAPKPHDPTPAVSVLYGLLWTVVVALPYMPLLVALSLLMVDSDEEAVS